MTGCRYFDSVDICKYRSNWMESRHKISLPSSVIVKPLVTQVEVFEATELDIGLFQEGARSVCSQLHIMYMTHRPEIGIKIGCRNSFMIDYDLLVVSYANLVLSVADSGLSYNSLFNKLAFMGLKYKSDD